MDTRRKVYLFIAMSLDGFIARPDGDLSFLNMVEQEGEDYGYSTFIKTVDSVILGRKTYDKVLSMGVSPLYENCKVYVWSRTPRQATGTITFYSNPLPELISELKTQPGKHIFCDGGAETIHQLLRHQLVDEIIISVIPVLLSNGIRLFEKQIPEIQLQLSETKRYEKGLVQLRYVCK